MNDLQRAILRVIASTDGPVGQGNIGLELRKQGFLLSIPTIGRRLQELEFEGFLDKVGVQGRVLTPAGRTQLEELDSHAMLRDSGNELIKTLGRGDKKHLLDLLDARRVIEGATASLAAERATASTIRKLEAIVERQAVSIRRGELGVDEDVKFHVEVGRASQNGVLDSLVVLLRQHHRYNLVVTSMRAVVGRLVVDHTAIVEAIKAHDPARARAAMERHLAQLSADLNRYWSRLSRDGVRSSPSRRRR